MFENLEIFRMSNAMAVHAGMRQAVVAENIANADTPGYAARDVQPFEELLKQNAGGYGMRATRASHLNGTAAGHDIAISERRDVQADPNGNSVSLELEMLNAVEVKRQHDRALAIYKSAMTTLRTSLGRG